MGIRSRAGKLLFGILLKNRAIEKIAQWEKVYGKFDNTDYENYSVKDLPSESGFYHGEIIKWATDLKPGLLLFVGENNQTARYLKSIIHSKETFTAGLTDTDYIWNFEENAPVTEKRFDLIISQAILEHLINPYKHFQDMSSLVKDNGHIIIHTVLPGFQYHRYPIDALRFYPDWFEESSKRLKLTVVKKKIRDSHIFYMFQKTKESAVL